MPGKFIEATPAIIQNLYRGYSLTRCAALARVDPRTLRINLRKGQSATDGPLRELYLAELATRDRRSWGRLSGPGRPFPSPSARTLAERAKEAEEWREFSLPRLADDRQVRKLVLAMMNPDDDLWHYGMYDDCDGPVADLSQLLRYRSPNEFHRERGRPGKLTFKRIDHIAFAIRFGSSLAAAAIGVGLHPRTLLKYLRCGRAESEGPGAMLVRRVADARRQRVRPKELERIEGAATIEGGRPQPYHGLTLPLLQL